MSLIDLDFNVYILSTLFAFRPNSGDLVQYFRISAGPRHVFSMCSGFNVHAPIDLMFTRIGRVHLILEDWGQISDSSTIFDRVLAIYQDWPDHSRGLSMSSPGALFVFSHSTEAEAHA